MELFRAMYAFYFFFFNLSALAAAVLVVQHTENNSQSGIFRAFASDTESI